MELSIRMVIAWDTFVEYPVHLLVWQLYPLPYLCLTSEQWELYVFSSQYTLFVYNSVILTGLDLTAWWWIFFVRGTGLS